MYMKIISTTLTRKNIKYMIDQVKFKGEVFAIGRRGSIDAILIQYPSSYNKELNDITNINTASGSFDFLKNEVDIYRISDLKQRYV